MKEKHNGLSFSVPSGKRVNHTKQPSSSMHTDISASAFEVKMVIREKKYFQVQALEKDIPFILGI